MPTRKLASKWLPGERDVRNFAPFVCTACSEKREHDVVFIPTSDLVDVAREVARGEGYFVGKGAPAFFDFVPDKEGRPFVQGYLSIGFYWNSRILNVISVNRQTGQVIDAGQCLIFAYPAVKSFEKSMSAQTGHAPIDDRQLAAQIGCDSLKRLTVPRRKP